MDDKTLMKLLDITPERLKEIDSQRKRSTQTSAILSGLSGAGIVAGMTYAAKKASGKKGSELKKEKTKMNPSKVFLKEKMGVK